jgi:hypothetical protein
MKLEAYQHREHVFACPTTHEEVDLQVEAWDKLREADKTKKH